MGFMRLMGLEPWQLEAQQPAAKIKVTRTAPRPTLVTQRAQRREPATGPGGASAGPARTINPGALRLADLRGLDCVRQRIKGTGHYVSDDQREVFGGREYLLVRDPHNPHDPKAVAVFGKGRLVGYVSASRAGMMAPILDRLKADAFKVSGTAGTQSSMVLSVDLPRVEALREYARANGVKL